MTKVLINDTFADLSLRSFYNMQDPNAEIPYHEFSDGGKCLKSINTEKLANDCYNFLLSIGGVDCHISSSITPRTTKPRSIIIDSDEECIGTIRYFDIKMVSPRKQCALAAYYRGGDIHFYCHSMKFYDEELRKKIKEFLNDVIDKTANKIHIIVASSSGIYTEEFPVSAPDFSYDNYNENFEDVDAHIKKSLVETNKGLILIHGPPGTGKTSYLRHLISSIPKKMIYMPPDLSHKLSSPDFTSFMMENTESVLIIEDAENILCDRENGGTQAVSNLLNISDGILGDALKMHIICTFNTNISKLDAALLRPGRLVAEHEFRNLEPSRAEALYKKLYGESIDYGMRTVPVSEIYNSDAPRHVTVKPKKSVGFV